MIAKEAQSPTIQVLERSFAVLDLLATHPDPVSLKEISERTGLHPSTAHRILNDLTIGRWAMVGMGSVVTKSVPDFHLVLGSPARSVGAVCRCGQLLARFAESELSPVAEEIVCLCGLTFMVDGRDVFEASMELAGVNGGTV